MCYNPTSVSTLGIGGTFAYFEHFRVYIVAILMFLCNIWSAWFEFDVLLLKCHICLKNIGIWACAIAVILNRF